MTKLLLRPSEAGEALGLSRSTIYELVASGEIPSVRVGRSVRVPVEGLKAWVERRLGEQVGGEGVALNSTATPGPDAP